MNKEARISKIAKVVVKEPFGTQEIMWEDTLQPLSVYKIPLEYLIYNKYNGQSLN